MRVHICSKEENGDNDRHDDDADYAYDGTHDSDDDSNEMTSIHNHCSNDCY